LNQVELPANQGSATLRRQTQLLYDLADRLEQVQAQIDSVSGNPVFELRVGYLYDGLSQLKNLARLKDSAQKFTIYNYDLLGRLVHAVDFLNPGRETFKVYADYCTGNLVTTPRGVEREATYDERCRLRQLQTQDETHLFDYDELNRLVRVRMGSRYAWGSPRVGARYSTGFYAHETAFSYDELDRVVEVRYIKGGVTETVAYSYNEIGDVISLRDVQGRTTIYDHYADGRLLSVSFEGQQFTYTHDAAGRLESLTYPTSPDTLVANFTWDDDGRLLSLAYLRNSAPFQSFAYTYDDSGNRVTMTEIDPNNVTVNWSYSYDWLNRLTGVSKNGQLVESYTYDESDNRITMTRPLENEVWEYTYDLADQLESITVSTGGGAPVLRESFVSDQDGNMLSRSQSGALTEYEWDTLNRLRQVKVDGNIVLRSLYDAEGIRRLSKDNGGQSKFFSSGGMSLADQRPNGAVSFIQGHQLLGLEQGGGLHFYITDALGSVRLVVDATGAVEGAFAQDAWGVPDLGVTPPGAELQAHSFVGGLGQRNDTASLGLYYARQRYYSPQLGRFLSQDPIGFAGGLNMYTYVENNPINKVDPSGLDSYLSLVAVRGGSYAGAGHVFLRVDPIPGTKSLFKKSFTVGYFPSGVQCSDMQDAYGKGTKRRKRTIVLSGENEGLFLADMMANIDAKGDDYPEPKKRWSPVNNCGDWALRLWNDFAPEDKQINPNQAVVKIHPYEVSNPDAKKAMKVVDIKTVDPQAIYNILGGEDPGLKR
jgi:RHS repeat-associated protein